MVDRPDATAEVGALKVGDVREVVIGPIAHGGHFVAHSDGRTLFVRHALPGERVRVRVTEINRRIVRADAIEVLDASVHRVEPPCRWSGPGRCGGCDFQHVDLATQRQLKATVLREALVRFGGIGSDDPVLPDTVVELPGRPDGLRWRTRVTWATDARGHRGLHPHRSHDVLPVDDCLIADEHVSRPEAAVPGRVVRSVRERAWRIGTDGFWQVHPALPEALVAAVLELGQPSRGQQWWDLYAGAGLFGAFLGEAVGPDGGVQSVEAHGDAIRAGRRALHDLPQVALVEADVAAWLARRAEGERVDGVVLDPPRAGAGRQVLATVATAQPAVIVYVACDPVALGRDVGLLRETGYRLDAVRAFDAFPMTHHLETVARFARVR